MTFETRIIDLAGGPVNLMADPDIVEALDLHPPESGIRVFVQNVAVRTKAYYSEQADAPSTTDRGHCLQPGDGFTVRLIRGVLPAAWAWATSTGSIAVSPMSD